MAVIRWSPFQEFTDFRREMDRLFDEFFIQRRESQKNIENDLPVTEIYSPSIDIYAKGDHIVIKAVIPEVKKEDINIFFKENILTIQGQRRTDEEVKDEDYYHREHRWNHFSRTINLPVEVDPENIQANYKDGILEIVLHKRHKEKTKKITVKLM